MPKRQKRERNLHKEHHIWHQ